MPRDEWLRATQRQYEPCSQSEWVRYLNYEKSMAHWASVNKSRQAVVAGKAVVKRRKAGPRLKKVWGVFDNSGSRIAMFDYSDHEEAQKYAKKLSTSTRYEHYVSAVKVPIGDKKATGRATTKKADSEAKKPVMSEGIAQWFKCPICGCRLTKKARKKHRRKVHAK